MTIALAALLAPPAHAGVAEIRAVDADTGRGVPLIEFETTHRVRLVTDNAGRAALAEPGLLGTTDAFLTVRGRGYDAPADGFGSRGALVTPDPNRPAAVRMTRRSIAARLCRLTGAGRWRDTALLGRPLPAGATAAALGGVAGQDSIQAAVYRGRIRWFWGDTARLSYPLGLFRTAGATSSREALRSAPADFPAGLPYEYFTDETGFVPAP